MTTHVADVSASTSSDADAVCPVHGRHALQRPATAAHISEAAVLPLTHAQRNPAGTVVAEHRLQLPTPSRVQMAQLMIAHATAIATIQSLQDKLDRQQQELAQSREEAANARRQLERHASESQRREQQVMDTVEAEVERRLKQRVAALEEEAASNRSAKQHELEVFVAQEVDKKVAAGIESYLRTAQRSIEDRSTQPVPTAEPRRNPSPPRKQESLMTTQASPAPDVPIPEVSSLFLATPIVRGDSSQRHSGGPNASYLFSFGGGTQERTKKPRRATRTHPSGRTEPVPSGTPGTSPAPRDDPATVAPASAVRGPPHHPYGGPIDAPPGDASDVNHSRKASTDVGSLLTTTSMASRPPAVLHPYGSVATPRTATGVSRSYDSTELDLVQQIRARVQELNHSQATGGSPALVDFVPLEPPGSRRRPR